MISPGDLLVQMKQASELYHKLVLLICPERVQRVDSLHQVAILTSSTIMNVNLELASSLLEITHRQRKAQLSQTFEKAMTSFVASREEFGEFILLDHIDILFEPVLEINPLSFLQQASRGRVVVAVWKGNLEDGMLTYGQPDHPAFRRYAAKDFLSTPLD
ncbi:BREX-3 system P-loop-containing protein BrxF [Anaerolineae bacterium CFX9]|nr:BREX-3 system P-loop-containing protein BrxF [Anaerolineae bacterium CFX9]